MDHPSVAMLQDQYRLLQLKKMLHVYGVRDFNFSDGGKGRVSGVEGDGKGKEGDGKGKEGDQEEVY